MQIPGSLGSRTGRRELRNLRRVAVAASASALISFVVAASASPVALAEPVDTPPEASSAAAVSAIPADTPAGSHSAHILDLINGDDPVSPEAVREWTDPSVAAALGPDGLAAPLEQLRTTGPYEFVDYSGTNTAATVTLKTRTGLPVELRIYVSADNTVNGLLVRPHTPDIGSFDDLSSALDIIGTDYSIFAARVDEGECVAVHDTNGDRAMPMASLSKLYVLGAVADAIEDGDLRWNERLTVTDALKSLPTGEMQNLADGSTVTVREAAEKMISVSDNTATDLLIDRLGRDAIEAQVAAMGHHDPDLLTPFPTTRETFLLGFGNSGNPELRETWREASQADRIATLDALDGAPLDVDENAIIYRPAYPDGVGWFASQLDICAAYAHLMDKATTVTDILAINPGLTLSSHDWSYTGFKGGSMPGVLATTWLLTDNSGQDWYFGIQQSSAGAIGLAENLYTFELAGKIMGRNDAAVLQIN
ncbi:serine hydrolase [Hoyosella altamirensis]|uniref:Beta-lactamase class A n=1 Tax=Hoyosella altamirensis TaxID=616997 RepID=A0A839RNJ2_9ACTN|nr:serine hydrolase [Hoyosella altamirensis]MBB3037758.1 beta-lactamase class A [Hoyosella altamirensis]